MLLLLLFEISRCIICEPVKMINGMGRHGIKAVLVTLCGSFSKGTYPTYWFL